MRDRLAVLTPRACTLTAPFSLLRPTLTGPSVSTNQRRSMDCVCSWLSSGLAWRISCFTCASSSSRRSLQYKKVRAVFHSRTSCGQVQLITHGGGKGAGIAQRWAPGWLPDSCPPHPRTGISCIGGRAPSEGDTEQGSAGPQCLAWPLNQTEPHLPLLTQYSISGWFPKENWPASYGHGPVDRLSSWEQVTGQCQHKQASSLTEAAD